MLVAEGHPPRQVDHAYHRAEPVWPSVRMLRTELAVGSMLAGSAEALVLFHGGRQFHGGQELTAGPLAAPAGLGAHSAVLVHPGMPLALVAAGLAGGHAGLQERLRLGCVRLRPAVERSRRWRRGPPPP